ncbi:hypothetical protein RHMOL_Rhmol01G0210100 [Rhododendron molle]|uniref:Uncharacterized protein n=1 Tax=Rhododendron molle TaxID=49168 RepID=A0ACC0Q4C2_RHOML|nr:hypothetical protein RHMOL_Rhmol01G0210100 [Rhododendron molle]
MAMKQESESELEPEPHSPTQTQKQCTFRSNVIGTVGLLSKLNLNNAHLELLKQASFWLLIDAIRKGKLAKKACMKHDKPILSIIENYDTNDSKFLIGGKKIAITRNEIKLIFGIACGNKLIGDLNKKKSDVAFATRRGIQEARIDRVTIAWTYVHCMEKIEEIKDYDWAQSIAETLNTSMHKFHDKPRDATGCVVALMYWICEHTNLIARPKNEAIPRLLNWNTSNLKKRFDDFEDLSNINIMLTKHQNSTRSFAVGDMICTAVTHGCWHRPRLDYTNGYTNLVSGQPIWYQSGQPNLNFLGGDQDLANRALDVVCSKILNTRAILIPIFGSNHYTLLELDTIDQEWRVDCAIVVAYIIRQKLMKKSIQNDLTKQQCLQMRADIVQAFVRDPKRSWTPEIYHNGMDNLRLQKYYDDQELLEEKKK